MTHNVVTVQPETPFTEVARILANRRISGVLVTRPRGPLLGVVSSTDLLLKEEYKAPELNARAGHEQPSLAAARAAGTTAAEIMSSPVVAVTQDTYVSEAARLMALRGFGRLPVVDRKGSLVGIVTRANLLRVFLRPDEEIQNEVFHEVLRHYLSLDISLLKVEVQDGVVRLSGHLDRASLVPAAERLTSAVEGVARVINDLTYEHDDTARARLSDRAV